MLFATAGKPVTLPVVAEVVTDSPAAAAGLQKDDRIEAIDGVGRRPSSTFNGLSQVIPAQR